MCEDEEHTTVGTNNRASNNNGLWKIQVKRFDPSGCVKLKIILSLKQLT